MNKLWLIQRAHIGSPLAAETTRLSNAVSFDYMGSAEFEFGALPESLRRIEAQQKKGTALLDLAESMRDGDRPLRLHHGLSAEELSEYIETLRQLRDGPFGTVRLKERSEFAIAERTGTFRRADFWWDLTNDVMFSFHKEFMNRLPYYLSSSFAYMNERKAS